MKNNWKEKVYYFQNFSQTEELISFIESLLEEQKKELMLGYIKLIDAKINELGPHYRSEEKILETLLDIKMQLKQHE